jgi:hypothetical protein
MVERDDRYNKGENNGEPSEFGWVKLFQIEEPAGGPADPGAPGAAIGIDLSGAVAEVAASVGGNAVVLGDRKGFEQWLPVPPVSGPIAGWVELFEGARLRAERTLARPVSHAVIAIAASMSGDAEMQNIAAAAEKAGLAILRLAPATELASETVPALAAAILAEDLAPRPPQETL